MRRFVLDAFFPIRAVIIRTFVPVVRTVLAPIAVAVLVRGRRDGADVAADVAGGVRVIVVDVRRFVLDAFGLIRARRIGTFVPVVRTVLAPVAVAVLMRGRRGIAGNGDLADCGFARTVCRGGGDRRGTCLDRRHGAVRGYRGNSLVRGCPSQSLVGGVLGRDRGGQRFAVSNRNRSFRLVKRDLGNRDDLGRDGALVAADVAGGVRIIGVDVRRFVLDASGLIRTRRVGAFVPVVRTVLAPVAVAVLVRGRRHGERRGLGVYGRRAHAVTARMVVRVPEHTAEQLAALCRRDGRDRIAGRVVPEVRRTFAAGAFDVRPALAAVGAALPLILQRVEILIDQLGGECHRITRSRGHALRLLRDHGRDAHIEPPVTGHGLDRIVGIGQRDMEANTLIVHFIRDGDGIGFARVWDRSPLLFRWHNVSAVLPAVFRCDARQRAYGIPGLAVVKTGGNGRDLALNEFTVSPHGRGRAAQICGTVVRGKCMGICRAILIRRRAAELCTVQGQGQDRLIGGFGRALDVLPGLAAVPADLPLQRGRGRAGDINGQGHVFIAFDHAADILLRAGELRQVAGGHVAVRLGIVFVPADGHSLDSCFSFQGKFFHFLTINRHRKIEYDLLYPASVFPFLREHLNSLDKGLHKLLLLRFRCGMVDFIKCQQQAIDIVSGNLLLLDAADLTLQFANLNFDFLYGVILLIIAALQVQNLSVIVGIIDVQGIHLTLQAAFRSKGLL